MKKNLSSCDETVVQVHFEVEHNIQVVVDSNYLVPVVDMLVVEVDMLVEVMGMLVVVLGMRAAAGYIVDIQVVMVDFERPVLFLYDVYVLFLLLVF